MISVPSHLLRLSGNNLFLVFFCIAACFFCACTTAKTAGKTPATPGSTTPKDAETPAHVYNPNTGKYEPVKDPKELVDTIAFTEDKRVKPGTTPETRVTGKKALYEVAFLIPFKAGENASFSGSTDPKVRRFVHYYAGVKLALQELADAGVKISAQVHDTHENPEKAKKLIQDLHDVDAIVGPYESESLKEAAEFSSRKQIPVFSPWTPSISLDEDHPNFIQLTPGLDAHAEAIVDYIDANLSDAKVYLVARNDAREKNRLSLYRDAHQRNGSRTIYEDLIIDDASVNLTATQFDKLLPATGNTVFIMPFYSRNDEDFINSFLRKLHGEKGTKSVYVFGLPQWLSFSRVSADYLESNHVHVSTAHFMDPLNADVRAFQAKFLAAYGAVPEPAAHQGYTFTKYLGHALDKYGTGFLEQLSQRSASTTGDDFDLVRVYLNPEGERNNKVNFVENRAIRLLEFRDQAYRIAR